MQFVEIDKNQVKLLLHHLVIENKRVMFIFQKQNKFFFKNAY